MAPHQERVVTEKSELDEKLVKLRGFFSTQTFDTLGASEQRRLYVQEHLMSQYSAVLTERIVHFK